MNPYQNDVGVLVPNVMLPAKGADFEKWAVVACDQYTSQPEYWEKARSIAGSAPTTLDLFLPEAFLGKPDEAQRIEWIRNNMKRYLETGILEEKPQGFVLVKRTVAGKTRHGLVMALDLEQYDYHKGSTTLIRATEGTIESRIPPRLRIREGAPLELPHILVLIDDPENTVVEPLLQQTDGMEQLYDTELMLDGGHIEGWLVSDENKIHGVLGALAKLTDERAFREKYGYHAPLLFAMGDGNHSFATAKANWEKIKATLPEEQKAAHPARYALVEVENVHDAGIVFEPIHRVVFGVDGEKGVERLKGYLAAQNGGAEVRFFENDGPTAVLAGPNTHVIPFFFAGKQGAFIVSGPSQQLTVGTLQNAIDALLRDMPGTEVDYIHGEDVVRALAEKEDTIGFLLPAMEKSQLFPTVVYDGALPRKTFSMGEANEKRYYLECRRIDG